VSFAHGLRPEFRFPNGLFADDTNLFVHGITLDNVVMKVNASLRSLSNWFFC